MKARSQQRTICRYYDAHSYTQPMLCQENRYLIWERCCDFSRNLLVLSNHRTFLLSVSSKYIVSSILFQLLCVGEKTVPCLREQGTVFIFAPSISLSGFSDRVRVGGETGVGLYGTRRQFRLLGARLFLCLHHLLPCQYRRRSTARNPAASGGARGVA